MSLQEFEMPALLVEALYKNSLVDIENKPAKKTSPDHNILFLGNNNKHIVLLVDESESLYLADNDLNFLIDILTACKLALTDTVIINIRKNTIDYQALQKHFKPQVIVCFGISLAELGFPLEFPFYQVQQYNNQSYLNAPSLAILAADKKEKSQLWGCLKKIFSL